MSRVSVGVGSIVDLHFIKPIARTVALAGIQNKCEIVYCFIGTILSFKDTGEKLANGKPDFEFVVTDQYGSQIIVKRSNIEECILHKE